MSPNRTKLGENRQRAFPLKYHLVTLLMVTILPAMITIGISVWQSGMTLKNGSRQMLDHGSLTLAMAVTAKMHGSIDLVRTISIVGDDISARARLIERFNGHSGGQMGRMIVVAADTVTGSGPTHSSGIPRVLFQQALALQRPVVSNLFVDPASSVLSLAVIAPPPVGAKDRSLIALLLTPENISEVMGAHIDKNGGILVALTDGTGRLIMRSQDPDRYVGKLAPDWARLDAFAADHGTFEAAGVDGGQILFSYKRLVELDRWTVVVGEPLRQFDARWLGPLKNLVWAGLVATLIALFACIAGARSILRPISALVDQAKKVERNHGPERPYAPPSTVSEFEELRTSLDQATNALRTRARAERRAANEVAARERRYRALATVGALTIWRRRRDGWMIASDGWAEFMGMPHEEVPRDFLNDVVPADRAGVIAAWDQAVLTEGHLDHEFRVITPTNREYWVRARGAPVRNSANAVTEWTGMLEDIQERRMAKARLQHLAYHDALTGLANRPNMEDALAAMMAECAEGQPFGAVLCIDLDGFKRVNDTFGHAAGDALLVAVSERLRKNAKGSDVICRIGGDEFIVLQRGGAAPRAAALLATRLIQRVGEPYALGGERITIGLSIGIALMDADAQAHLLIRMADRALYRAKSAGRGRYFFYDPQLDDVLTEHG